MKKACCLLLLLAAFHAWPQETSAPQTSDTAQAPADDTAPVIVPPASEKAMQYYRSGNVLWALGQFWDLFVPALILFTGLSAWLRDRAWRFGRMWYFALVLYFIMFTLIVTLLDLPFAFHTEYIRQHAYGLSNQTLAKWLSDTLTGTGVGLAEGALFLWVPYLLLKKSPRRWWIYTGLLVLPFMFFMMLVEPIVIDPLFNKFGPMKNQQLEQKILSLAERAGIENSRVFEVDKSVDTKAVNAYVKGFRDTKRIVLWDTIIAKLDERELLFVMGHEMGHYVLNHVVESIFIFWAGTFIALFLVFRLSEAIIRRYSHRIGFRELSDFASLPLLLFVGGLITFVTMPLTMAYTRHIEHEADRFALEITHDNHAGATAFVKLQEENLSNPYPGLLVKLWRGSHPSIGERVDFCNSYHPWREGQPQRYEHLFKKN